MTDFIIIAVLILVIGCASFYVYKSKKSGNKCIGCPNSCTCCAEQKATCRNVDCAHNSKNGI